MQLSLDREVALKVLLPGSLPDRLEVVRFERETKLHLGISHPNAVSLYDAGTLSEVSYLVLELMEGGSLAAELQEAGAIRVEQVIPLARTLVDGLDHLHREGILHRDLKPANIHIGSRGELKLADLGLARSDVQTLITMDQALVGTILYMAPELLEESPHSTASDVYALGLVIWEMLVGRPAIQASGMREALEFITGREIPTPRQAAGIDAPEELQQMLGSMLDRDPSRRPSLPECSRNLRALSVHGGPTVFLSRTPENRDSTPRTAPILRPRRDPAPDARVARRSRRAIVAGSGVALLCVIAFT